MEDSDEDEDDDDDDDDDDASASSSDKKRKKLRKMREVDELDDDDLALINEAKGISSNKGDGGPGDDDGMDNDMEEQQQTRKLSTVKAKSAQELSRGLFTGDTDSEDEGDDGKKGTKKKQSSQQQSQATNKPERYDEDGLDDFIEDDTGYGLDDDEDDYGRRIGGGGRDKDRISEAQINEAEEIFGTDYLDFMDGGAGDEDEEEGFDEDYDPDTAGGKRKRRKSKFKEAGVGVALGVDSDEEIEDDSSTDEEDSDDDDDDADLFGDDDMEDDMGYKQRAEVLKLKREKKRLAREERRRQKRERIDAKRKAQLRRAFEPVQLVENFCTEKDDAIRMADSPERYYDWLEGKKSVRKVLAISDEIDMEEEEEAMWIMSKIPAFSSEIATAVSNATAAAAASGAGGETAMIPDTDDVMEKADRKIIESIVYALRYMRGEKLEPEFIKRYRMDIVTSPAVRDNLYRIMDEDSEWERMTEARAKIEGVLQSFKEEEEEGPAGSKGGPEVERASRLKEQFKVAEEKLNDTVEQERKVQEQLDELEKPKEKGGDDDDDDDDLFGDDDEDDEAVSLSRHFLFRRDFSFLFQVHLLLIL